LPVEIKPHFRPDVLRPHLAAFQLPPRVTERRALLSKWATMLASGKAGRFNETEILPVIVVEMRHAVDDSHDTDYCTFVTA
jgi:hypothetical protein